MQKNPLYKLYLLLSLLSLLTACGGGGAKLNDSAEVAKVDLTSKNFSKFSELTNQFIESSLSSFFNTAFNDYGYSMPTFSSANDTVTLDCPISGTKGGSFTGSGKKRVFTYTNCKGNGYILHGSITYEYVSVDTSTNKYSLLATFSDFTTISTDKASYEENIDGSFKTDVEVVDNSKLFLESTINIVTKYPNQNEIFEARNVVFKGVNNIEEISGDILINSLGVISLVSDKPNHRISLIGSDKDIGYIKFLGNDYEPGFISSDSKADIIGSLLNRHDTLDPDVLLDGINLAPELSVITNKETNNNSPLSFTLINHASDKNHDALNFKLEVLNADFANYSLSKSGISDFTFNSNRPNTYNMKLTVTDPYGLNATKLFSIVVINLDIDGDGKNNDVDDDDDGDGVLDISDAFPLDKNESIDTDYDGIGNNADPDDDNDGVNDDQDAFPLDRYESLDTDLDGTGNNSDWDDDNDGVLDEQDALPLDKNESKDFDGDGVGDNADLDDDNDGTVDILDLFPLDSQCSTDANSAPCFLKNIDDSTQITSDPNGIVYFLLAGKKLVVRWDSFAQVFLTSISLGSITSSDHIVTKMTYSISHNRLYIGYNSGVVSYIELATSVEHSFTTVSQSVGGLVSTGKFILVQNHNTWATYSTHYYYDKNGDLTDSHEYYYSTVYAWNAILNRVYFYRDGISPNDIHYEETDPATGKIISAGESPYHGDYSIKPPIIINETGDLVMIGSGSIFNATALKWVGAIPDGIIDAHWTHSTGLVVIRDSDGSTLLERRDNDTLDVIEETKMNGSPLKVLSTTNGYFILSRHEDSLLITPYSPNNDTDGDGTLNLDDNFPLDKAAAIDSDNDGYPNYWNTGLTESDSTTGLTLDSYPQDSACYLPEHGDGVSCNVSSTLPNYTSDKTIMGANGIIYLFSKENNRIFRWSISLNDDLSPIIVGSNTTFHSTSPDLIAYSENHNRLYLGYKNGEVTYISLSDIQLKEQSFTTVAESVRGLASVGDFVLIQDSSGARETHYFYDQNGNLTNSNDWNYYSEVYAWNATLNRVYFIHGGDIYYEGINPATGERVSDGETPYFYGEYSIEAPILVSPDESQILTGSGNVFNATSLSWESAISNTFEAGLWETGGDILTLRNLSGTTRLDHYDSSNNWISEKDYLGTPVGLFEYQNKYYVVTNNSGEITVVEYTAL